MSKGHARFGGVAIQPVDTLPADGSSSPVVLLSTDGKVYSWDKVGSFNGSTSKIVIAGKTFRADMDFDIDFCVKDSTVVAWEKIFTSTNGTGGGTPLAFGRSNASADIYLDVYGVNAYGPLVDMSTNYQRCRLSYNATTKHIKSYCDGVEMSDVNCPDVVQQTKADGFTVGFGDVYFSGKVYCVRLSGAAGTLEWHMKNISGGSVPDSSGNGNTGTVTAVTVEYDWVPIT